MNANESKGEGQHPLSDRARAKIAEDAQAAILHAAELVVQLGAGLDGFMLAAHGAYMQANPAAREELETTRLLTQLEDLRRRGLLPSA